MLKCLYCYGELEVNQVDYHPKCITKFYGTKHAPLLPYRFNEMEKLAKQAVAFSISVPGVQPKLSLGRIKTTLELCSEATKSGVSADAGKRTFIHEISRIVWN